MKTFSLLAICTSFLCLCFIACIEPLDLDQGISPDFIVIDGVVSNSPDERTITVLRGNGNDVASFEPIDVRGNIYRDGVLWDQLAVQGTGELYVPFNLKLEEGRAYEIEITTPNKDVFRSSPQTVQPLQRMDSLSFEVENRVTGTSASGLPKFEYIVDIFAHVQVPDQVDEQFYRWQTNGTFSFEEITRPNAPANSSNICYISHQVTDNPTTVLSTENLAPGSIRKLVNSRVIDESFLFRHVINIYMHSIDKESYQYYDRAIRLTQSSGNLYDEVPAPLAGNVKKIEGEPEVVLGQIDFSLVDTLRIDLGKGVLGIPIINVCTSPTPCPNRPPPPGGGVDVIFCKCWDCQRALSNASLFPPFFWDE